MAHLDPAHPLSERHRSRLRELADLTDGWRDGDGLAPTAEALDNARRLLASSPITADLRIYPTLEGGVSLAKSLPHGGWCADLTDTDATVTVAYLDDRGSESHEHADHETILSTLTAFLAA